MNFHPPSAEVATIAQAIAAQIAIETGDTHWSRDDNTRRAQYALKAVFIGKVAADIAAQVDALLPAIVKQIAERQPDAIATLEVLRTKSLAQLDSMGLALHYPS